MSAVLAAGLSPCPMSAQTSAPSLPQASVDPMRVDPARDPVLGLGRTSGDAAVFRQMIARAVGESPSSTEAAAEIEAADAARDQARAGLYPYVDIGANSYRTIARRFDNNLETIVEQSRAESRTDITLNAQQTVIDFGATSRRIDAASARLRAAAANSEDVADRIALRAIGAWYDVFVFRALVRLGETFSQSQRELRTAVDLRIREGLSAPGDLARVESYIASADIRLAQYRRQLGDAEARFTEMLRTAPPPDLLRAPLLDRAGITRDFASEASRTRPAVRVAELQAEAARQDARAVRADTMPVVTAGIQAGRYGLLEDLRDYDVRGVVTLRKRFFGGVDARADQARAQAASADARASRVREEASREAIVAWSDVRSLEAQLAAVEQSYVAARRSRDVLVERFRVARGTLFDVLAAEDGFFLAATSYIQVIGELDAARYVLLSRTGRLLPALQITPAQGRLP